VVEEKNQGLNSREARLSLATRAMQYQPPRPLYMNSRRQFLLTAPLGLLGAVAACRDDNGTQKKGEPTAGAPPAFNTAPPVGPEVSADTFAEAEKLVQVSLTPAQRAMASRSWRTSMAALLERRTGPRKIALDPTVAPASHWSPATIAQPMGPAADRFVRSAADPGPLPSTDDAIAFAPVTQLSRWIESRKLTSERLTNI
jgi:hypothetical protein